MIAIVDNNTGVLNDISSRLNEVLKNYDVLYDATSYGEPMPHPDGTKYALIIKETNPYNQIIINNLTPEEKNKIEYLHSDWFQEP
jgi:hypothetical protein